MALANVKAPMHKNRNTTMGRINGHFSTGTLFRNINLSGKVYEELLETQCKTKTLYFL
jgi:hypothetical protein